MYPSLTSGMTKGLHGHNIQGMKVLYNCGFVSWRDDGRKIKNRYPRRSCGGDVSWHRIVTWQHPSYNTKRVRTAAGTVSEKRLSDGQVG